MVVLAFDWSLLLLVVIFVVVLVTILMIVMYVAYDGDEVVDETKHQQHQW